MTEINGVTLPFMPAGGVQVLKEQPVNINTVQTGTFGDIFEQELNKLKFSAHAKSRMTGREINLSQSEINRLENAVDTAGAKGAGDSLIMLGEKAFIVNIPNKTVITVVNRDDMASNIVTNIDSAVFA